MSNESSQPLFAACAYLVRNGLPYDVVMGLDADELSSWCIAFGELDGAEFDWSVMRWRSSRDLLAAPPSPQAAVAVARRLDARGPTDGVGRVSFEA